MCCRWWSWEEMGWGTEGVCVGVTSVLATVQRKPEAKEKRNANVFLSSLQISLTFFPLFHKNAWEEEELCICFPRVRTLLGSSKSRSLGGVWFTPHLMSQTLVDTYFKVFLHPPPPTHTHTNDIWQTECFSSQSILVFYLVSQCASGQLPPGLTLMWLRVNAWIRGKAD